MLAETSANARLLGPRMFCFCSFCWRSLGFEEQVTLTSGVWRFQTCCVVVVVVAAAAGGVRDIY